jgi:hypothetical protein
LASNGITLKSLRLQKGLTAKIRSFGDFVLELRAVFA